MEKAHVAAGCTVVCPKFLGVFTQFCLSPSQFFDVFTQFCPSPPKKIEFLSVIGSPDHRTFSM